MADIVQTFDGGRQEPIGVIHYIGTVANGATVTATVPNEGLFWLSGMAYSDQNVTVDVDQGDNDQGGVLTPRHNRNFAVAAGTSQARLYPLHGKFVRVTLTNASGFGANVEIYFVMRGFY